MQCAVGRFRKERSMSFCSLPECASASAHAARPHQKLGDLDFSVVRMFGLVDVVGERRLRISK